MNNGDSIIAEKLVPCAKQIVESCIELARELKFDKKHPQHLSSVITYATILEIATGINVLVEMKQFTCIPILLRTLLDAFASFRCCSDDPKHSKAMCATFLKEKRRLLSSAGENAGNPYLKKLAETINVEEDIAAIDKELAELKDKGHKPLKVWDEFEKAGLKAEYQSLYWQLCMHAHNNVSVLEDRHLEKRNGDYEVALFKEENPTDIVRYLDSMCGLVLDATSKLHALLETGLGDKVQKIAKHLEEVRALHCKQPDEQRC